MQVATTVLGLEVSYPADLIANIHHNLLRILLLRWLRLCFVYLSEGLWAAAPQDGALEMFIAEGRVPD